MITPGTVRFFSKGEGASPQMRPVPFYIWLAQLASGEKGGDARARRPLAKKVGGMGQKSYMGHGIAQTSYGQALEL